MSRPASLDRPVVSPVLVGREAQIATLAPAIERAQAGAGSTVLVSGEAGIGKTRLVDEIRNRFLAPSGASPGEVAVGRCFELDQNLPFAPLVDLLRDWLQWRAPAARADWIARAPDELRRLLPELAPGREPLAALDPEEERRRIFRALLDLLTNQALDRPLLVILEDLHWSDDTSLEFLPQLARLAAGRPLLLLLTYRADELTPGLRRMLAALDRERLAAELSLDRLSLNETETLLRAVFAQPFPIRRDFLLELHRLTDGNPFFIEEVIRSLLASGDIYLEHGAWRRKEMPELRIPRSIQDAVQRRAERLSVDARRVLQIAAVAGQRFDFAVLESVAGRSEAELLVSVRELVASQLVVEESAERFTFRHALTREAVYGELLARERRSLHLAIGEALERLDAAAEMRAPELAYHFHAAADWARTLAFARLAGERALALFAPHEAIQQLNRALESAERLGIDPPFDLLRQRALARATLGQFQQAEQDLQATLAAARKDGDRPAEWQALLDLGGLWVGRDYERAGQDFSQALKLAQVMDDRQAIARSHVQLANWQVNTDRLDDARRSLEAALAEFEGIGDAGGVAQSLDLLGIVADLAGDIDLMCLRLEQALERYRALDDRIGMASVLATLSCATGACVFDGIAIPCLISPERAVALSEESLALSRETGWRSNEAFTLLVMSMHLAQRGLYRRASEAAAAGLAIAEEINHQEWRSFGLTLAGVLALEQLDPEAARDRLERACEVATSSGSSLFILFATSNFVRACIAGGDLAAAAAARATFDADIPMDSIGQRLIWLAEGELARAAGDSATALEITEQLFATARNLTGPGDAPHLARLRGEALLDLGQREEAEDALRAAIAGAEMRGMRPLLWRLHVTLAGLLEQSGRETDARGAYARAWAIIEELAHEVDDDARREQFLARAAARFPAEVRQPREAAPLLTVREREVAELVAAGLSNREIGERLFVGARTVETHVSHILTKLEFSTRAQIAAWVAEQRETARPSPEVS